MSDQTEKKASCADDRITPVEASDRPATPCIVHISDTLSETVYWLSADKELKIGRAPENELCIRDQSVSQFHARVVLTPKGTALVEDLGSTNGTWLNAVCLPPHSSHMLKNGDMIQLGQIRMQVVFHGSKPSQGSGGPESIETAP